MNDKGRILIVDDDRSYLLATASLLRREGFECDCGIDAAEAVCQMQSIGYDLVISDIELLGDNNLALIHEIRRLQPGVPVILIAQRPATQTTIESLKSVDADYLVKSSNVSEWLSEVRKSIESYRVLNELRENHRQVAKSLQDLEGIQEAMKRGAGEKPEDLDHACLEPIIKNIAQSVGKLQRFGEFLARQKSEQAEHKWLNAREKEALIQTLRKGVTALEKSRASFKSKELGDLRHELSILADSMDNALINSKK